MENLIHLTLENVDSIIGDSKLKETIKKSTKEGNIIFAIDENKILYLKRPEIFGGNWERIGPINY